MPIKLEVGKWYANGSNEFWLVIFRSTEKMDFVYPYQAVRIGEGGVHVFREDGRYSDEEHHSLNLIHECADPTATPAEPLRG